MVLPSLHQEAEADRHEEVALAAGHHAPDRGQDPDLQEEAVHDPMTMIAPLLPGMIEEIQGVDQDPELLKTETEEVAAEVPLLNTEMIKSVHRTTGSFGNFISTSTLYSLTGQLCSVAKTKNHFR